MNMRSALLSTAAAIVVAPIGGSASAATAINHGFSFSDHAGIVEAGDSFPAPGTRLVEAGAMKLRLAGRTRRAAEVRRLVIDRVVGNVAGIRGGVTVYLANGGFRVAGHGTVTIKPDGSEAIEFRGRVVGGTGRYRGASGHLEYRATSPTVGGVDTGRGKGAIAY